MNTKTTIPTVQADPMPPAGGITPASDDVYRRAEVAATQGIGGDSGAETVLRPAEDDAISLLPAIAIDYRSVASLTPRAGNPRTHSKRQIRQIAESIRLFGFTNPVLIDASNSILAGHGRVAAAKLLGIPTVPTIQLKDMTEAHKRAYVLADNKLAQNAGWDSNLLAVEFQYLTELDLDFDITITGFEFAEIDLLMQSIENRDDDPASDRQPETDPNAPVISLPGDLWLLGKHRLLCGDATEAASFQHLMACRVAQMVFTDPPYNVAIDGHVCGLGGVRHRDFLMASGEMSEGEFTAFLSTVLGHLAAHSSDGSIHYVCMDWRHMQELLTAGRSAYAELKNLCIWNKDNGGMGAFYRSKHELVFVFKNGTGTHINNFELGQHGRYRTNVWDYAGTNTLKKDRLDELRMHPTVKPTALVADAMLDCSRRGGIVLDAFCGSGTTLIAAERTGRAAYAMELEPRYVDTAIRRWQEYTGREAIHASTGMTWAARAAWSDANVRDCNSRGESVSTQIDDGGAND